jgi:hypothetical protein
MIKGNVISISFVEILVNPPRPRHAPPSPFPPRLKVTAAAVNNSKMDPVVDPSVREN